MAKDGKKKKGNVAKSKEPAAKEFAIITREDLNMKETKHMQRLSALNACLSFIQDDEYKMEQLKEAESILEKWVTYLKCEGLPKPYLTPEVRLFFEKLRHFERASVEKTIDWLLSVNERSILTQNIFRKDATRKTLLHEICPEFGIEYDQDINLALKVLRSVEYYLDDETKVALASSSVLHDIIDQKKIIQQIIRDTFDRYIYRILSSEESYMTTIDSLTAEYTYLGEKFALHLWTTRNVPIRFEYLDEPKMIANLHRLDVTVQIPYSVLCDNLTLSGLHQYFDHYSEHAKSYEQEITMPTENLNAGIQNLHECLVNEWNMQIDLMQDVRNDLIQKRIEFEERKKALDEENERKAKEKKNANAPENKKGTKEKKPGKLPKEPPVLTDDLFPDIWDEFLVLEQNQFEDFIKMVYHPNVLMLEAHQINLKRFFILGGVYRLNFVSKPRHIDFNNKFNMTWHENDGNLVTFNDVRIDLEDVEQIRRRSTYNAGNRKSRLSRVSRFSTSDRQSLAQAEPIIEEWDENSSPLFVLNFVLPSQLCLWGEPLPCQYLEETIYVEEKPPAKPEPPPTRHLHTSDAPTLRSSTHSSIMWSRTTSIQSFPRSSLSGVGRMRHSLNAYRPSLSMLVSLPAGGGATTTTDHNRLNLDDFILHFNLTKTQIRNMARHCMPRVISSFKFPKELRDEEDEENRNKPKGKGGTLVRRRNSLDEDTKINNPIFSYESQNNPERLFPIFDNVEPLKLPHTMKLMQSEPATFFELIDMINDIKRSYQRNVEKILQLRDFRTKIKLPPKVKYTATDIKKAAADDAQKMHRNTLSRRVSRRQSRRPSHIPPSHMKQIGHSVLHHINDDAVQSEDNEDNEQPQESEPEPEPDPIKKEFKISSRASIQEKPVKLKAVTTSCWTNKFIHHYKYNKDECRLTIWTDRLGTFGFAFKRYEHFPFRDWSLEPSKEKENELIFTLETQYVRIVLYITNDGYRGYVTEPSKKFIRNRAMYLTIDEPLTDFKELKRIFREHNVNIFTEHDACFYIENGIFNSLFILHFLKQKYTYAYKFEFLNLIFFMEKGYFSEKHLATEMHTYCCMAVHSSQLCFSFSDWNRLAKRRDLILQFIHYKDALMDESKQLVHITPEEATFVEIKELCSDDLDIFKLEYTLTWRNIDHYADLHHLISSMYPNITDSRIKDPKLVCCIKSLLCEIRPLSFS